MFTPLAATLQNNDDFKGMFMIGTVVENNDPLKQQRVKCRLSNVHREINDASLPWSLPMIAGPQGNTNTIGGLGIPVKGAKVWVIFPSDDNYDTYYFGGVSNAQTKIAELLASDYPDSYGSIDAAGNLILINTKTNTLDYWRADGTRVKIDASQKTDIIFAGNVNIKVEGSLNIKATGDINLDGANVNINSGSNSASELAKETRPKPVQNNVAGQTNY